MITIKNLLAAMLVITTSLLPAQTLNWVLLDDGAPSGSCTSTTDCPSGRLCYGLEYTPSQTGVATSYTFGFLSDCPPNGLPTFAAESCRMDDNTDLLTDCGGEGFLFQPSGNNGSLAVVAGSGVVLHQVCFTLADGESITFPEDATSGLTVSLDLPSGVAITENLNYATFTASRQQCDPGIFPVDWRYFEASPAIKNVVLNWGTENEVDNEFFDVEWRSTEGSFTTVGTVAAGSSARSDYEFVHNEPAVGDNFYRLRQVDQDGTFSYSEIRKAYIIGDTDVGALLYPNPTAGNLTLSVPAANRTRSVKITDPQGRVVSSSILVAGDSQLSLTAESLPGGVYYVWVDDKASRFVKR